jgi:hypothetical protein
MGWGGSFGRSATMLDKFLTGIIWFWGGLYVLVFVGAAIWSLVYAYTQGAPWWFWPYAIFWLIPTSLVFPDGVAELFSRILYLSPAIGAYFWREHRREKASRKRMADPKNWTTRTEVSRVVHTATKKENAHIEHVADLQADIPRIFRELSLLQQNFPDCIMDTSWLPRSKVDTIEAFKIAWIKYDDDKLRGWIETGWLLLAWFQDGVAQTPIKIDFKADDIPERQRRALSDDKLKWLSVITAESSALIRDCDNFKQWAKRNHN